MQSIKLNDIIDFNPKVKLEKSDPYSFIPMENITPDMKFVSDVEKKEWQGQSSSKFENGDILFARIYPCLDNRKIAVAKIDGKGFGSTEFFVLRAKEGIADQNFVYYLSKSDLIVQTAINSYVGASGRQRADLKFIKNSQFNLPSYENQKKIAAILATYDDLIDVNKKRITILENIAEELYKEWFVRFRFPNWQNTEFEKGVPSEWNEVSLNDLGKIVTGKTPSLTVSEYHDGEYPFYKTPDMHNKVFVFNTEDSLTEYGLSSQKSQIIEENSIMVTCIGTGGVTAISTKRGCTNQQINSISLSDKDLLYWAFLTIRNLKPQIELFGATGTTMTNLSKGKFGRLLILRPSLDLIKEYQNIVEPIFDQIKSLGLNNANLIKQKDVLLPRLISGKLLVDHLDIQYPPSMQTSDEAEEK